MRPLPLLLVFGFLSACGDKASEVAAEADADTDADTDSDTDVDVPPPAIIGRIQDKVGTLEGEVSVEFWPADQLDSNGYPLYDSYTPESTTVTITAGADVDYGLTVLEDTKGYMFAFFDSDGDGHYTTGYYGKYPSSFELEDNDKEVGIDVEITTEN